MFRPLAATLRRALMLPAIAGVMLAIAGPAQGAPRPATHIVQLRDGVSLAQGRTIVRSAHGRVTGSLPIIDGLAVRLPRGARVKLARDPRVVAVTVNARVRSQDASAYTSQLATAYPYSVLAPQGWNTATGRGVGVAVIDTGVDGRLPDFSSADGTSRVVASAVTNPDATTAADTYGHGTHVAGIIAGDGTRRDAADPAAGKYVGIAPEADIVAIKASDDAGGGTVLDAIYGLQFAVDHRADYNIRVVNLSLSSTVAESYTTDPLDAAAEAAYFQGILVVAAAGNRGSAEDAVDYAPGNDPFVLSVGAVDDQGTQARGDDTFADWSSRGTTQDGFTKPEIGAPGAHIVSTLATGSEFGALCPSCIVDEHYIRLGGTSMASPVVSGVAALLFQAHPDWTPDEAKSTLIATARNLTGSVDEVNAAAAIDVAAPYSGVNAGIAPNSLIDSTTGDIDYTRSSWGRSSWGAAPETLVADWARSSWGCTCSDVAGTSVDDTRSSWGSATWLANWSY
jgi:serine protease AprX